MRQKLLLSAALIGFAAGPALAQTSGTSPSTGQAPATSTPTMSQSAPSATGSAQSLAALPANAIMGSRLDGMDVKSQSDENLGEIDDVVLDQQGKVHQVIIKTGGVLGLGGKKVALAWDQVRIDPTRQVAVISMTQDQIKSMPEFKEPERERDRGSAAPAGRSPGGTMGTGGAGGTTTRP